MITNQEYNSLPGKNVNSTDGSKIGTVEDVYASTDNSQPTFITVKTGMLGGKASFVPVAEATMSGDDLVVPYDKDQVKDAPNVEADEELTAQEEDRLYKHYNLSDAPATDAPEPAPARDGDGTMTRSEEQLRVGTQKKETGRARLVKHVVTEQQQATVPVSHQEAKVVSEPITDGDAVGTELTEDEVSVTLTEEVPVVSTEAHAVERVRLDTETVTEEETVKGEVRKEVIETEGVDKNR